MHITKLVTGGRTGVDAGVRAFAKDNLIPWAGWAEKAQTGLKRGKDPEQNVTMADAAIILLPPRLSSPHARKAQYACEDEGKPVLVTNGYDLENVLGWLDSLLPNKTGFVLYVTGPDEGEYGRGEQRGYKLLSRIFEAD